MRFLVGILLVFVLLAGCERRGAAPAAAGPAGKARIVAMSPALGIMLKDLGLEEKIVGRHAWDLVLEESLPVCGDQQGLDYEALIRARPTHVLLEWGQRPLPERLRRLAKEHGWRVESFELLSLDQIVETARAMEGMFEAPTPVSERLREAFALRDPGRFAAAGRVLLLMTLDPPSVMGPGSAHHQLLERLGAQPAITEGRPHIYLDAESTARLAPDGLILFLPRKVRGADRPPPTQEEIRAMLGAIVMLHIPAVEKGRIAVIDHPLAMIPSTSLAEVGAAMERILAEWSSAERQGE